MNPTDLKQNEWNNYSDWLSKNYNGAPEQSHNYRRYMKYLNSKLFDKLNFEAEEEQKKFIWRNKSYEGVVLGLAKQLNKGLKKSLCGPNIIESKTEGGTFFFIIGPIFYFNHNCIGKLKFVTSMEAIEPKKKKCFSMYFKTQEDTIFEEGRFLYCDYGYTPSWCKCSVCCKRKK